MYQITLRLIILCFVINSCDNKDIKPKFINNKQVPIFNSSDSKIAIIGLDNIIKDSEFCASIVQTTPNLKILAAYIGSDKESSCDFSRSLVDTALKQIDNCAIALKIKDDTGIFCLTPSAAQQFNFKLAVLSIDKRQSYYLDTLDLEFVAIEKTYP